MTRRDDPIRIRRYPPKRLDGFVDAAGAFAAPLLVSSIGRGPSALADLLRARRGARAFAQDLAATAMAQGRA